MHLYLMTRGIKHEVDQFITELQGKYLPFQYREKGKDKTELHMVQLAVRPIQLWEIVFPAECKDMVLSTCLAQNSGDPQQEYQKKYVWALRKALKIDPIPKYDNKNKMPIRCAGIELVGVGIKPDYWVDKEGKHLPASYENPKPGECYEGL